MPCPTCGGTGRVGPDRRDLPVGGQLAWTRKIKELSQADVAKALGLRQSQVSRLEQSDGSGSGYRRKEAERLLQYARFLAFPLEAADRAQLEERARRPEPKLPGRKPLGEAKQAGREERQSA